MEQEGGSAVWIFVWKLKDEEVQSQSTIHAAERGDEEPARKRFFPTVTTAHWMSAGQLQHWVS